MGRRKQHGHASGVMSKTYRTWAGMKARCQNPNEPGFRKYGARGITVCNRWLKFENFLVDMGVKPHGLSIDRINNSGDYGPTNCRWATIKEQNRNKSGLHVITFDGKTQLLQDWADSLGIKPHALIERLRNWPIDQALTQPKRPGLHLAFRDRQPRQAICARMEKP